MNTNVFVALVVTGWFFYASPLETARYPGAPDEVYSTWTLGHSDGHWHHDVVTELSIQFSPVVRTTLSVDVGRAHARLYRNRHGMALRWWLQSNSGVDAYWIDSKGQYHYVSGVIPLGKERK